MRPLTAAEIRQRFLDFFADRGHQVVRSAALVPQNDPTLLFTNAGMVPFKDAFLGRERRDPPRAASAQKCVRAGGKHNDLEQVGFTARHHTFFEMLGNFSFGDYFKEDAIRYAWEFLTEVIGLPPEKLWITVFREDDDAARIWTEVAGVDPARVGRRDEADNFWQMGDTGPCGPCSEIHYYRGEGLPEGADWLTGEGCDGDVFMEIWNLVFMQFDRDAEGTLNPLPSPSIDTGMGLERIAAVVQGVETNYEVDLLREVIAKVEALSGKVYGADADDSVSMRVIADHARSTAFLIADGVMPGAEGRGYVLRRILRRAVRHGRRLGFDALFFSEVCGAVVALMGEAYPELGEQAQLIEKVTQQEEGSFRRTLDRGLKLLDEALAELGEAKVLPGEIAFRLYDTYGFPLDLTEVIAREHGVRVDQAGFDAAMAAQQQASAGKIGGDERVADVYMALADTHGPTRFTGYGGEAGAGAVLALLKGGAPVEALEVGEAGECLLDATPFYGESGGQVGDAGALRAEGLEVAVTGTLKPAGLHVHQVEVRAGRLEVGAAVQAQVDVARRDRVRANHSATHLMHLVLKEVLGEHVKQAGSLVAPELLRFDYTHFEAPSPDQLAEVERRVNAFVAANASTQTEELSFDEARERGAVALFGEKYGDEVRTVRIGERSFELCGGTHVRRAGDVGFFKIASEGSIAAGVRRIVAHTRDEAVALIHADERRMRQAAGALRVSPAELDVKVEAAARRIKELEKALSAAEQRLAAAKSADVMSQVREVAGVKVLTARLDGEAKALREMADKLRDRLGSGVIVLGADAGGKAQLLAAVTPDLTGRFKASELIKALAPLVSGRGGGKPELAQAGGSDPAGLDKALASVDAWIEAA